MDETPPARSLPSGTPKGPAAWAGLVLAPPLALAVYVAMRSLAGLDHAPSATAALATLVGLYWITEALPLAATSLLPLVLFPLCGVLEFSAAAAPYVDPLIYVYLGGFLLALAIERWNLHRRIALHLLLLVGAQPARLVGGLMLATALMSMWISNTATTAMMLPLGLSLVALTREQASKHVRGLGERDADQFATSMMLGIAYAATIGGLGTLIGTPTNTFLAGFAANHGLRISFGAWMLFALPIVAFYLLLTWLLLTRWLYRLPAVDVPDSGAMIRAELAQLGPITRGELVVSIVFGLTALLWLTRAPLTRSEAVLHYFPTITRLNDGMIALAGAILLFAIPIDPRRGVFALDWETGRKLPWGVLLLFGGGLSLAEAVTASQLADWIGQQVAPWGNVSMVLLVVLVSATVIFASEFTSNVATVAAFAPIMLGVSQGLDADPMLLLVATALAASCAFMLPVGTPPNAIAFGTGYIKQSEMMRAGFVLNLLGVVVIPVAVYTLGVWILGLKH